METKKIQINDIKIEERMRTVYAGVEELAASFREKGQLSAILVTPDIRLIAGGRRLAAAKFNGWEEIEAKIINTEDTYEIEFIENHEREDFAWPDFARGVSKIHEARLEKDYKWSAKDTARVIGLSKSSVLNQLQLAKMMAVIPGLDQLPTEAEAFRKIDALYENIYAKELAARPEEEQKEEQPVEAPQKPQSVFTEEQRAQSKKEVQELLDRCKQLKDEGITDENGNRILPAVPEFIIDDFFTAVDKMADGELGDYSLIECDPPYGIGLDENKESSPAMMDVYNEISRQDYPEFLNTLMFQMYRILGNNARVIFWYGPEWYPTIMSIAGSVGFKVNPIPSIWYKPNITGQNKQPRVNMSNVYEPFLLLRKGTPILGKFGAKNVFAFDTVPDKDKIHPTERPIALIEEVIQTVASPKSTSQCLVPFLGSGNTLIACKNLGIKVKGYEKSQEYKDRYIIRR